MTADEFEYVARLWQKGLGGSEINDYITELEKSDIVIFNGEGSLYRNNYTAIKGLFMLWYSKTQYQKPSYFINGSVTLSHVDQILPAIVKKTFLELDGIYIREPYSLRNLFEFYPFINASFVPDAVFSLFSELNTEKNISSSSNFNKTEPYICVSPPMLLTALSGFYRMPKEESLLYQFVLQLKEMVPQVVFLAKEPRDMILKKIASDTGSILIGPENNFYQVIEIIRNSRLLI